MSYAILQAPEIEAMTDVQVCSRCLYDENTPAIVFDDDGVCNYCRLYDKLDAMYPTGAEGEAYMRNLAEQIKKENRGKKYDVVVGVSGGCDSSFLLQKTVELGLRPLAVHFDNTWNSTTAVENIYRVLKALDVDLYTLVVDNEEYDDIYRSFLKAGVPDIEAPTDIGLAATLYRAAEEHGIKYIFEGHSFRTEGVSPLGWLYMDGKYIQTIQKTFGSKRLKTFPNLWLTSFLRWTALRKIKKIRPLYFIDYHKESVKSILARDFGWQWYGGHHLENRFTAFYHTYFLPQRFGIDQRLNGYSALVRSGQMSREEGMVLMSQPPQHDEEIVELVKKRLGFSDAEFDRLMNLPRRTFREFKTYKRTFERMRPFFALLARMDLVPQSFYIKYTSKNNI
jgi:N-acetyl sugar amidotransferase